MIFPDGELSDPFLHEIMPKSYRACVLMPNCFLFPLVISFSTLFVTLYSPWRKPKESQQDE